MGLKVIKYCSMPKKDEITVKVEQVKQNETLTPVKVEAARISTQEEVFVPDGHVYIVSVDENGNEKPNTGFFYPEKNHLRYYGDTTKFLVKKKATK